MAQDSEFIEIISDKAIPRIKEANDGILELIRNVKTVNQNMVGANTPSSADSAIKKLTADYDAQARTIRELQSRLSTLAAVQNNATGATKRGVAASREQSVVNQILRTETDRNIRANTLLAGAYARASAQLLILKKEAKDAAIRFGENSVQARKAAESAAALDGRIKAADASVGDFQRNVGNYSNGVVKGFQSIFASVRQLAYILPGIGIAGIFSLALDPLFELIKGLDIFNDKLIEIKKNTQDLRDINLKIRADSRENKETLQSIFSIATNPKADLDARTLAVEKLRSSYYYFFKQYTDAEIKAGKVGDAITKATQALAAQSKLSGLEDYKKGTEERIELIKSELQARIDFRAEQKKLQAEIDRNTVIQNAGTKAARNVLTEEGKIASAQLKNLERSEKVRKESLKTKKEEHVLNADDAVLNNDLLALETRISITKSQINNSREKSILLEDKENQRTRSSNAIKKEKIKLDFEESQSEYNLKLALLERQKAEMADRANNDKSLLDDRIKARQEFSDKSIEILNLQIEKEKKLLSEKAADDLEKNQVNFRNEINDAGKNDKLKAEAIRRSAKNILDITKRLGNEIATVDLDFSLKWNDLMNGNADFYFKLESEKREFTQKTNDLILQSEKDKNKKIADNQVFGVKYTLAVRQKAFEEYLKLAKKELLIAESRELSNARSIEQMKEIQVRYSLLNENLDKTTSETQKAEDATKEWIKTIGGGQLQKKLDDLGFSSAKIFLDLDENGQSTFEKLFEGANLLGEKLAVIFQAVGDVAQDVFNSIAEAQNRRFENQYANLERERDIALAFAGDNAAGREEIERQFQARKRQIELKEFEAKKKQSIANINIDLAQAVIGLYAEYNYITATVLGGILTGLALFQISQVNAQQPPAYAEGTDNHPGGYMKINDGRGANYQELVETPDGKKKIYKGRNVLVNAPKGTKVTPGLETSLMFDNDLNNILTGNGIMMQPSQNIDFSELKSELREIASIIKNKESFHFEFDDNKFRKTVRTGHTQKEIMNAKVNFKGRSV